ncbi:MULTISPECIES: putative lipopolysaccharide heptosyltransferase III [unclassified Lebetimonas]|uniref:putative lipopolysaccharide heptosyltransferase III n=1 Tax=unclassified Lebetimonas TaxID=2648158 RepID=UPI0004B26551|nr:MULTISPECIES: putative lipopolysaccharide heptosyltransferase III [unclassified Lebetimonas]
MENGKLKILVIKFRNIGDVLLTTPLIKNLKLNYPDSQIDCVVNKGTEEMLTLNPNINNIFTYDRSYFKSLPKLKRIIEEFKFLRSFRNYDIIINTTEGDRGAFIAKFSRAKIKIGFSPKKNIFLKNTFTHKLQNPPLMRHIIENNLDAIRILNKKIFEKRVKIFWDKKDDEFIDSFNLPKKFVHFHPVSRWLFKCIDDTISAKIIDFIQEELNLRVVLTAAPVEAEIKKIENIKSLCKTNPIDLSGKLSLKQTAALNKRAKFFIGVDTAIMHISAANDIPVIAFFGPSGAFNWGPWDNNLMESGYNKKNGFQKMGKHRVIQVDWDCAPCGQDGCNGSKISECLISGLDFEFIKKNIEEVNENT